MNLTNTQQQCLRRLPGVDVILQLEKETSAGDSIPKSVFVRATQEAVAQVREKILSGAEGCIEKDLVPQKILATARRLAKRYMVLNLRPVVNATGVIVHTNLGRSPLTPPAIDNIARVALGYSNLEYNLSAGKRGSRYTAVEDILCELSGAEAALAVNNNAGAVLLCLAALAKNREVIVSRGELVEIGGAFRIPDIIESSGCMLKEVGTTNRTHLKDYRRAINENTALILKVHKSNYSVVGFSSEVPAAELVALGNSHHLPVIEDLGSGTLIDFSQYGLIKEPTVQDTIASGVYLATFSGDKLLGGPQAGIIVGKKKAIEEIKQNPLTRALRIDKLTLAALESTLHLYRDPRRVVAMIPTLRMLTESVQTIETRAGRLQEALARIDVKGLIAKILTQSSRAGGGSLPLQNLESRCVAVSIKGISAQVIERYLRAYDPPIIGRIDQGLFLMDARTIKDEEIKLIKEAFASLLKEQPNG